MVLHGDCHNKLCTNMYANCTGYDSTHFHKKKYSQKISITVPVQLIEKKYMY